MTKKVGAPKQKRVTIPEKVGKDELAKFFGLSKRQIERWEEEGLPKNTDGPRNMYNLKDVFDWRYAKIEEKNLTELDLEKLRETKGKADKIELEVSEKKGELLPTPIILKAWQSILTSVKTAFRGMPSDIKIYDPKVNMKLLDFIQKRINEILQELSESEPIPPSLRKFVEEYISDDKAPSRSKSK